MKWAYRSGELEVSFPIKLKVFCKGSKMVIFFSTEEVLVIGIAGTTDKGLTEVTSSFIKGINKTLAVMWFLPTRELAIGNLWNIDLYNGDKKPNDAMLLEMFHSQTIEADTKKNGTLHDSNLKFDGFMSKSGQATLKITVHK